MAQISRPFQIALLAMVVLAGVWFFALQGHSSSGGSSAIRARARAGASPSAAAKKAAGAPTTVYHGAAPGVEGLSRAIANAHKAVATSEQNAKQLASKSAQASSPAPARAASRPPRRPRTTTSPATAPKVSTATLRPRVTPVASVATEQGRHAVQGQIACDRPEPGARQAGARGTAAQAGRDRGNSVLEPPERGRCRRAAANFSSCSRCTTGCARTPRIRS